MIPYHDENQTQRTPIVTFLLIAASVFMWIVVQGAGMDLALAESERGAAVEDRLPAHAVP